MFTIAMIANGLGPDTGQFQSSKGSYVHET